VVTFHATPYALAQFVTACVSATVAVMAWQRRAIPGGVHFTLMMCAVVVWNLMSALEASVEGLPGKLLFSQLAYIGTSNTAPLFFLFALRYRTAGRRVGRFDTAWLFLVPAATIVLAFTNPLHGLVWPSIALDPRAGENVAVYSHGPWYWVSLAYYFAIALSAVILLGRTLLRARGPSVAQLVVMLTALAMPWLGVIVYLLPINPFPGLDLVSIGFAFSGALLLVGITRLRLLELLPVARDLLVEEMADAVLVLSGEGRIVDANPSARSLLGLDLPVEGSPLPDSLSWLEEPLARVRDARDGRTEATLPGSPARCLELRASPLRDRRGRPAGTLLVISDITGRRAAELEREKLIGELRGAVADIRTLSGLLPICASCKKIRDDGGYWQGLEQYLSTHSQAQFSHSLCPECIARLYPEFAQKKPEDPPG
jgi:PAS domain S-box-containing protein